jgi:hypothetical protein
MTARNVPLPVTTNGTGPRWRCRRSARSASEAVDVVRQHAAMPCVGVRVETRGVRLRTSIDGELQWEVDARCLDPNGVAYVEWETR